MQQNQTSKRLTYRKQQVKQLKITTMKAMIMKAAWKVWKQALESGNKYNITFGSCLKAAWAAAKAGLIKTYYAVISAWLGKRCNGTVYSNYIYVDNQKIEVDSKEAFEKMRADYYTMKIKLGK